MSQSLSSRSEESQATDPARLLADLEETFLLTDVDAEGNPVEDRFSQDVLMEIYGLSGGNIELVEDRLGAIRDSAQEKHLTLNEAAQEDLSNWDEFLLKEMVISRFAYSDLGVR